MGLGLSWEMMHLDPCDISHLSQISVTSRRCADIHSPPPVALYLVRTASVYTGLYEYDIERLRYLLSAATAQYYSLQ